MLKLCSLKLHLPIMLQVGEGFHVRSLLQATSALPFNVNPLAQLTKATWPYVVPFGVKVSPFGILRLLQSGNVQHVLACLKTLLSFERRITITIR